MTPRLGMQVQVGWCPIAERVIRRLPSVATVSAMPQPGDPSANVFVAEVGQCWRMIHDRQGQATHCREAPTWTGPLVLSERREVVEGVGLRCTLEGLTGLRESGLIQPRPTLLS